MADEDPTKGTSSSNDTSGNPIVVDETEDEPTILIRADNSKENMGYIDRNELEKFTNLVSVLPKQEQIQILKRLLMFTYAAKTQQQAKLQQDRIESVMKNLGITKTELKGGRKTRKPKNKKRKLTRRR